MWLSRRIAKSLRGAASRLTRSRRSRANRSFLGMPSAVCHQVRVPCGNGQRVLAARQGLRAGPGGAVAADRAHQPGARRHSLAVAPTPASADRIWSSTRRRPRLFGSAVGSGGCGAGRRRTRRSTSPCPGQLGSLAGRPAARPCSPSQAVARGSVLPRRPDSAKIRQFPEQSAALDALGGRLNDRR
jgi:hypothetical protein